MTFITALQDRLKTQYDLDIPYDVAAFVSHDKLVADCLSSSTGNSQDSQDESNTHRSETVFVHQENDCLEFTLYLDEDLIRIFDTDDARDGDGELSDQSLQRCNSSQVRQKPTIDEICTVVEGVSHAICLLWHAHNDRQIRPVDLELQAEIDKFMMLLDPEEHPSHHRQLHRQLFVNCQFISSRAEPGHERYRVANDLAARYCHWLLDQFAMASRQDDLDRELARFYRLSGHAKFEHIRRLH